MSFAQIKFPLDAAPSLVLQFTAPIEIVNSRPLGGDQQEFYFVVTLAMFYVMPSPACRPVYVF